MKKKIISILFALALMLTLCIIVSADEYTEWSISEDGQTLIVGSDTYKLYEEYLYPTDKFLPEKSFIYENTSPSYLYLKRNYEENGIMIVSDYYGTGTEYIYVNNEGRATLNSFINGAFSNYKISDKYFSEYASTSKNWINNLDGGSITTIDVRSLETCERYYILGYDSTETVAHIVGAVYDRNDTYFFVNYDNLSNNYFDANGNFSYRQGTVKAYKLNTAQSSDMVEYLSNMTAYETSFEGYEDALFTGFNRGAYVVIFVLFTIMFGFITPLVPVIIGAIRVSKGKSKNPKRWYLMFIGCGLWIVFAICILLTLIF